MVLPADALLMCQAHRQCGTEISSASLNPFTMQLPLLQAQALRELLLPLQAPEMFARYHITPPHGMLLYGPPGWLLRVCEGPCSCV
jgi:hypothetical protein